MMSISGKEERGAVYTERCGLLIYSSKIQGLSKGCLYLKLGVFYKTYSISIRQNRSYFIRSKQPSSNQSGFSIDPARNNYIFSKSFTKSFNNHLSNMTY